MENQQYHIGKEIEKEMIAQGLSVRELAEKIHLSPQAVYDIFKKNHIATDRLAEIQQVLGRDFFKELSQLAMNNGILADSAEEDEAALRERFEMLMPENQLHVLDYETFHQLAVEFVNTEHHKPLVIFHNHWQLNQPDIIKIIADRELRPGQVFNVYLSNLRKKGKSDDEIIQEAKSMPQPILEVTCGNYDADLLFLSKLAQESGKKVYAYCREENALVNDYHGAIAYRDRAVESFGSWCEHLHFVFVDDEWQSYRRNRWLYLAYTMYDVLNFLKAMCPSALGQKSAATATEIWNWLNDPKLLMKDYRYFISKIAEKHHELRLFRLMYFDDDEVSITRESDIKWVVNLPACENYERLLQGDWVKEQLEKYHVSTSMWIKADEHNVFDHERSIYQQLNHGRTE